MFFIQSSIYIFCRWQDEKYNKRYIYTKIQNITFNLIISLFICGLTVKPKKTLIYDRYIELTEGFMLLLWIIVHETLLVVVQIVVPLTRLL